MVLYSVGEEGEREHIDRAVDEEGDLAEDLVERPRERRASNEESAERCNFEERHHAAAQALVVARLRRHIAEDRRDARRRRRTLKEPRGDEQRDRERERRDQHRNKAEERTEKHHRLPTDLVGEHPEDR